MSNTSKLVEIDHVKEKLIELVNAARDMRTGQDLAERIADHLIANDVVPVVRCKDCKKSGILEHNGKMFCKEPMGCLGCVPTKPDAFCSHGERKDNGSK